MTRLDVPADDRGVVNDDEPPEDCDCKDLSSDRLPCWDCVREGRKEIPEARPMMDSLDVDQLREPHSDDIPADHVIRRESVSEEERSPPEPHPMGDKIADAAPFAAGRSRGEHL